MSKKRILAIAMVFVMVFLVIGAYTAQAWDPVPVLQDPLVRMPGTQQDQGVELPGPGQCFVCHGNFDPVTEPGNVWQGSMMAQAARDFLFWSTMTVAAQDAIWAIGNPNATDICLRCHMPGGWMAGRSDPTNGSMMTGKDFDAVQCNMCHYMYDPFFEDTFSGLREGNDWLGYWDESNASPTPSQPAAQVTHDADQTLAAALLMFNGQPLYAGNQPPAGYTENASGQFYVSTLPDDRRSSFADANATHAFRYSRYHKSKYYCATCHDVSNPVLQNIGADPTQPLPTETESAHGYYHVERTFSEFMLSDFGQQGGAAGIGPYDPAIFDTSRPGNNIASCQDCHMRDEPGKGAALGFAVLRPDDSVEHPKNGVPTHDLTGGNIWVSTVLASTEATSPNYDPVNDGLLNQGSAVLTLDLSAGEVFDAESLLAGADRAERMLEEAAAIQELVYDPTTGELSFRVQNQTGHKLISGYPEGRRMYLNVRYYDDNGLLLEVNPYDYEAGTMKGLTGYVYDDPDNILPEPQPLTTGEIHVDELVYEMHGQSSLTGEDRTFHFVLSDDRYKDNRIPPKGFRIAEAGDRIVEPVWQGVIQPNYFTAEEYDGGYDAIDMADYGINVPGATYVSVILYYQTTSREYMEFLRNEINGTGELTLQGPGAGGDPPYLIQDDPFFNQLSAWGDTMWQLWRHNMNLPGATPVYMTQGFYGTPTDVGLTQVESAPQTQVSWLPLFILALAAMIVLVGLILWLYRARADQTLSGR